MYLLASLLLVNAHLRAVPFELALDAGRDHPEQDPLGKRRRHAEVRARRIAALAGANPVPVVPRRARQNSRRELVIPHPFDRQQPRVLAVGPGRDHALVADKDASIRRRQASRPWSARQIRVRPGEHLPLRLSSVAAFRNRSRRWTPFRPRKTGQIAQIFILRNARDLRLHFHPVVPEELHRRHRPASRKIEPDHGRDREHHVAGPFLLDALDARRLSQPQRHVGRPQNVARHIAQRPAAEIVKSAPVEGIVELVLLLGVFRSAGSVRTRRSPAQPEIPIERRRNRLFGRHFRQTLRPDRTIGPGVHFGDVADLARPDHFGALPAAFIGVALVAHLRRDVVLGGRFRELARLPDRARQRLLHVHVLAALHAAGSRRGVHEIGNRDDDRVDAAAFLVEHLAEIPILGRLVELREDRPGRDIVDVAQRHDVLRRRAGADVARRLPARPDRGDVELLVGRLVAQHFQRSRAPETARRNSPGQQRSEKEMSPRERVALHRTHLLPPV